MKKNHTRDLILNKKYNYMSAINKSHLSVDYAQFADVAWHTRAVVMAIVAIFTCAVIEHLVAIATGVDFGGHILARSLATMCDVLFQVTTH